MASDLAQVDLHTRAEWREWLVTHHASSPGVWLVRYRKESGKVSMAYEELVCEALCFGWIDSLVRKLDDRRYVIKVTPRRPTSRWSALNRKRWLELKTAGLLAPPGLAAAPSDASYPPKPTIPELPEYIRKAFRAVPAAWRFFRSLPASDRRNFVTWIHTAKRDATRQRRINEAIERLSSGSRLGLK